MRTVRSSGRISGGVPGTGGCTWSQGGVRGKVLPPCGQAHACKNITFATSLRTVKNLGQKLALNQ